MEETTKITIDVEVLEMDGDLFQGYLRIIERRGVHSIGRSTARGIVGPWGTREEAIAAAERIADSYMA
jgi:hypothetical protein